MPAPASGPNKAVRAVETIQDIRFSSGPMIFTYLKLFLIRDNGDEEHWCDAFQWVTNPTLDCEYDYDKGHFWV
jgi:hypothetical protein